MFSVKKILDSFRDNILTRKLSKKCAGDIYRNITGYMTMSGAKKEGFVRSIVSFGKTLRKETVPKIASVLDIHFKSCFSHAHFHEYLHKAWHGIRGGQKTQSWNFLMR